MTGVRWSEQDLASFEARRDAHKAERQATIGAHLTQEPAPHPAGCPIVTAPRGGNGAPTRRARPEQDLQILVAEALDWGLPPPLRWMHIPNGEKRDPVSAAILKGMGVKPGAADGLILGTHVHHGLPFFWLELKSKDGRLSDDQKDWRDWCLAIGAGWALCRSLGDVHAALADAGIQLKVRPA